MPHASDVLISGVRVEATYADDRSSDRPPIVLVHGGCHGSWCWRRFQPFLADRGWETHALNWFGHNGSERLDEQAFIRRGLADMVEEVSIVARSLRAPPIVVGHSMGGMVAQKYAEATGNVRAMVLLAAVAPKAAHAEPKDLGVASSRPWGPPPFDLAKKLFFPENDEAEARALHAMLCPESPLCVSQATQAPPEVDVAKVTCPVLVIGAETDLLVPADVAERTARLYGSAFILMKGRGHGLPLEPRWAETAGHVHDWLAAIDFDERTPAAARDGAPTAAT